MKKTEAKKICQKLRDEGITWEECAKRMHAEGFTKTDGTAYTGAGIQSCLMPETTCKGVKPRRRRRTTKIYEPQSGKTSYKTLCSKYESLMLLEGFTADEKLKMMMEVKG